MRRIFYEYGHNNSQPNSSKVDLSTYKKNYVSLLCQSEEC